MMTARNRKNAAPVFEVPRDLAHKGYMVRRSLLGDCFFVMKDGFSIATFDRQDQAINCIDQHLT